MILTPVPLLPGDKVTVIAPAGNISPERDLQTCLQVIRDMGFTVSLPRNGWPGAEYLSGDDVARADEFNNAWNDPEVKCIWSLRGGYGSLRLIEYVDFSLIRNNPKFFIGFSDITILLNQIFMKSGLVTLHGPVVSSLGEADRETIFRLESCLKKGIFSPVNYRAEVIRSGPTVTGRLFGGNLCSLVSLLGTRYQPDFTGGILFLEDVNEPAYKIDRMLTQLFMSGVLHTVRGIVLGAFSGPEPGARNGSKTLTGLAGKRLMAMTDARIPIWSDFPAGHCAKNLALPVGSPVVMDSLSGQLIFNGGPVDDN